MEHFAGAGGYSGKERCECAAFQNGLEGWSGERRVDGRCPGKKGWFSPVMQPETAEIKGEAEDASGRSVKEESIRMLPE